MNTLSQDEPFRYTADPVGTAAPRADDAHVMIRETRREIGRLVREVSELVKSRCEPAIFWPAFLERVIRAMTADGALIWQAKAEGPEVLYRAGEVSDFSIPVPMKSYHDALLCEVVVGGEPVLVPPSPESQEGPANPTRSVAALVPIEIAGGNPAILEVFLADSGGPAAQRGFLRFAAQMADLAGEYLRDQRVNELQAANTRWHETVSLARSWSTVDSYLLAAQEIAEAFCKLTHGCRVSVCTVGRPARLVATSGVVEPDRRSREAATIEKLAALAADGGAYWPADSLDDASGSPDGDEDASEPIHSETLQFVAAIPMRAAPRPGPGEFTKITAANPAPHSPTTAVGGTTGDVVAVLVLEHERPQRFDRATAEQLQDIADLAGRDLRNIERWESIPLLRRLAVPARSRKRRTQVLYAAGTLLCALLFLLPVPFQVTAAGTLHPLSSQSVYAPADGIISRVLVAHGDTVVRGQPLLQLASPELDRTEEELLGEQAVIAEKLRNVRHRSLETNSFAPGEQSRIENERQILEARQRSIERQLQSVSGERAALYLLASRDGEVDAWEEERLQPGRPVRRGERFMRIVDADGPWEVRAEIPQHRLAPVIDQLERDGSPSAVVNLRAFPGNLISGTLTQLGPGAVAGADQTPIGLARIAIDPRQLPLRRRGAAVHVAIPCGKRPAGYVFFHDLIRSGYGWLKLWLL